MEYIQSVPVSYQKMSATATTESMCSNKNQSLGDLRDKPDYSELCIKDTRLASNEDLESSESQDEYGEDEGGENARGLKRKRKPMLQRIWKFVRQAAAEVIQKEKPLLLDLETPQRYRPNTISGLCQATGFTPEEVKRMYSNFKNECPTGLITKEDFRSIFSKFFPTGANLSSYPQYIFNTMDSTNSGLITFEDFAIGLSSLLKGDVETRLRWTFSLYDINKDGVVTKEEIREITASVYDLLGCPNGEKEKPGPNEAVINRRTDIIFQKLDLNGDGVITLEEFLSGCLRDSHIAQSLQSLDQVF